MFNITAVFISSTCTLSEKRGTFFNPTDNIR